MTRGTARTTEDLRTAIDRAGYYPELVADTVGAAVGDESMTAHLVHQETTFDSDEVRRHVTVLVLTPSRLVVAHTDDHAESATPAAATSYATTSTEAVSLERVSSVVVTRVVADPARYVPGTAAAEVTLTIGWGAVSRLELEPASCGDPSCEADHGYSGTSSADDLSLRVSAAAEGADAVRRTLDFARALSAATVHRAR